MGEAADEDGVVYGVFVGVGDLVEQVVGVGKRGGRGGRSVEVEEGVEEEVVVGEREEAGDGCGGVELLAGAEGGGAGGGSEKRAEVLGESEG